MGGPGVARPWVATLTVRLSRQQLSLRVRGFPWGHYTLKKMHLHND